MPSLGHYLLPPSALKLPSHWVNTCITSPLSFTKAWPFLLMTTSAPPVIYVHCTVSSSSSRQRSLVFSNHRCVNSDGFPNINVLLQLGANFLESYFLLFPDSRLPQWVTDSSYFHLFLLSSSPKPLCYTPVVTAKHLRGYNPWKQEQKLPY